MSEDNIVTVDTRGDSELFVRSQVAPFAVNRHSISWANRVVQEEQLTGIAVAGGVNLSVTAGNHGCADLGQHVDDAKNGFLITGHQRRGKYDQVAITYGDLAVFATRHA